MGVRLINHLKEVALEVKEGGVELANQASAAHVATGRTLTPLDKGNLRKSYRREKKATNSSPEAVVALGGIEVDGVVVDYHHLQNYGFTSGTGVRVPGHFMWEQGMEEGMNVMRNGVQEQARNVSAGRRRTFVETEETELVG